MRFSNVKPVNVALV